MYLPIKFIEGSYLLGPNQVNGKAYWIQKRSTTAIWYMELGAWGIGSIKNLGSNRVSTYSPDHVNGPLETSTWNYPKDGKWITTDIVIQPGT